MVRLNFSHGTHREHAQHARRVRAAATALATAAPRHAVHRLAGHRLLLVGPPALPTAARCPGLRVWPEGAIPPRVLGPETVVVAALGAAAGAARLLGATVVVPAGATGRPDTDLQAKAAAAVAAIDRDTPHVVVHVGGADEAEHERDPAGKVAAIERADHELLAPIAAAVRRAGGSLTVCPDHGCDPATGEHDAAPVPSVTWPGRGAAAPLRLTERQVASLPVAELCVPHREAA